MSTAYEVRATRWSKGWELAISGPDGAIGVSQCSKLIHAEGQARDYLATLLGGASKDYTVSVSTDLGGAEQDVDAARNATAAAVAAQAAAADQSRRVVHDLVHTHGLSLAEVSLVLGVSRARAQQLAGPRGAATKARARKVIIKRAE